jgi:hypothetical protein
MLPPQSTGVIPRRTQQVDSFDKNTVPLAPSEVAREKPACAGNMGSAVSGHDGVCLF